MLRFCFRVLSTASLAAGLFIAPTQVVGAQSTAAVVATSPDVIVISAGAAPRRALRYKLVKGATESVTMRQKISMNMEMGGMAMPAQSLPVTVMTTRFVVADVAPDGAATVTGEIVNVDLDPEGADPMLLEAMRPPLALMNGVTMSYRITATGQVSDMAFGAGAPAELQSLQSLGSTEQLSVAFPTEPVGVGARWKAARPVKQNGMTIQQDVEYAVKSLGSDSMILELVLVQSAKDQVLEAAALPPGATAKLQTLDGKGTSTVVIHFNRVQPSMDMKMDVKMAMDLSIGGQSNSMNQTMVMEMKTGPTPKP